MHSDREELVCETDKVGFLTQSEQIVSSRRRNDDSVIMLDESRSSFDKKQSSYLRERAGYTLQEESGSVEYPSQHKSGSVEYASQEESGSIEYTSQEESGSVEYTSQDEIGSDYVAETFILSKSGGSKIEGSSHLKKGSKQEGTIYIPLEDVAETSDSKGVLGTERDLTEDEKPSITKVGRDSSTPEMDPRLTRSAKLKLPLSQVSETNRNKDMKERPHAKVTRKTRSIKPIPNRVSVKEADEMVSSCDHILSESLSNNDTDSEVSLVVKIPSKIINLSSPFLQELPDPELSTHTSLSVSKLSLSPRKSGIRVSKRQRELHEASIKMIKKAGSEPVPLPLPKKRNAGLPPAASSSEDCGPPKEKAKPAKRGKSLRKNNLPSTKSIVAVGDSDDGVVSFSAVGGYGGGGTNRSSDSEKNQHVDVLNGVDSSTSVLHADSTTTVATLVPEKHGRGFEPDPMDLSPRPARKGRQGTKKPLPAKKAIVPSSPSSRSFYGSSRVDSNMELVQGSDRVKDKESSDGAYSPPQKRRRLRPARDTGTALPETSRPSPRKKATQYDISRELPVKEQNVAVGSQSSANAGGTEESERDISPEIPFQNPGVAINVPLPSSSLIRKTKKRKSLESVLSTLLNKNGAMVSSEVENHASIIGNDPSEKKIGEMVAVEDKAFLRSKEKSLLDTKNKAMRGKGGGGGGAVKKGRTAGETKKPKPIRNLKRDRAISSGEESNKETYKNTKSVQGKSTVKSSLVRKKRSVVGHGKPSTFNLSVVDPEVSCVCCCHMCYLPT